jgi:hypothetical protein
MSRQVTDLNQTLEGCQILLCLLETDLEAQEAILAEEQERSLHPPDKRELSVDLDKTQACVDRINGERVI